MKMLLNIERRLRIVISVILFASSLTVVWKVQGHGLLVATYLLCSTAPFVLAVLLKRYQRLKEDSMKTNDNVVRIGNKLYVRPSASDCNFIFMKLTCAEGHKGRCGQSMLRQFRRLAGLFCARNRSELEIALTDLDRDRKDMLASGCPSRKVRLFIFRSSAWALVVVTFTAATRTVTATVSRFISRF